MLAYAGSVYFLSFSVLGCGELLRVGVSHRAGSVFLYLCGPMGLFYSRFCALFPFTASFVAYRMSGCGHKTCDFGLRCYALFVSVCACHGFRSCPFLQLSALLFALGH